MKRRLRGSLWAARHNACALVIARVIVLVVITVGGTHELASSAWAKTEPARDCTPQEKAVANEALTLTDAQRADSISKNLPYGAAKATNATGEQLLVQNDYVIDYDSDLRVPLWVAYRLDSSAIGKIGRINCFRADPRLTAQARSDPSDYKEPIFDQGHMAPNGDMTESATTVVNSFIMSNMTPQYCQFNRGVWEIFESLVRYYAQQNQSILVMSGSVFDRNHDGQRDEDADADHMKSNNGKARVAIPAAFYKILVLGDTSGRRKSLSVMLPNDKTDLDGEPAVEYLESHITTIAKIEKAAAIDVFPKVGTAPTQAVKLWAHIGFKGHSLAGNCP